MQIVAISLEAKVALVLFAPALVGFACILSVRAIRERRRLDRLANAAARRAYGEPVCQRTGKVSPKQRKGGAD